MFLQDISCEERILISFKNVLSLPFIVFLSRGNIIGKDVKIEAIVLILYLTITYRKQVFRHKSFMAHFSICKIIPIYVICFIQTFPKVATSSPDMPYTLSLP